MQGSSPLSVRLNFLPPPNGKHKMKGKYQVRKGNGPEAVLAQKTNLIWQICSKYLLVGHDVPTSEDSLRKAICQWFQELPPAAVKDLSATNIEHYLKYIVGVSSEAGWFFIRNPRTLIVQMTLLYIHRDLIKERFLRGDAPLHEEILTPYTLCRRLYYTGRMQWADLLWKCYQKLGMPLSEFRKICEILDMGLIVRDSGLEYTDQSVGPTVFDFAASQRSQEPSPNRDSCLNYVCWEEVAQLNEEWERMGYV